MMHFQSYFSAMPLTKINTGEHSLPDYVEFLLTHPSFNAGDALTEQPNLRFAVGSFDSQLQLGRSLDDLCRRGLSPDGFHYLALSRVFSGEKLLTHSRTPASVAEVTFPENREPFGCTTGILHDCLLDRLGSDARSLKDALSHWLLPRHAAHFQEIVDKGKIQLWIRLTSAEDERNACQSLLANSSNSVGVHDLVPRLHRDRGRS